MLWDLSLNVQQGEFVALVGANGAGKTTLLKSDLRGREAVGRHDNVRGQTDRPDVANHIVNLGLSHIPESRKLFTEMSIRENLEMGAYPSRSWKNRNETMKQVFKLFPRLEERKNQLARTLSGGEQQMLAMGRGIMSQPKMCIVDEPSNGLAPRIVTEVFEILKSLHAEGITILLVEQNVRQTLAAADRAYVLENGRMTMEGACQLPARERPRPQGLSGSVAS